MLKVLNQLKEYIKPKIVYDLEALENQMIFLNEAARINKTHLLFTIKSFPHEKIIELAAAHFDGFEVSNLSEYDLLSTKLGNKYLSINDPTCNIDDINIYLSNDVFLMINLDTFNTETAELIKLYSQNPRMKFGLRVSHTALNIDSSHYSNRISSSRFGERLENVIQFIKIHNVNVGIHIHNGSEENNKYTYSLMAKSVVDLLTKNSVNVNYINFGGGLHTISNESIPGVFEAVRAVVPENIQIFFEPGHVICYQAGYAIAKIKSIKERRSNEYIVTTDISYECNLKWSIPQYHTINQPDYEIPTEKTHDVDVIFYGSSCYENDFIRNCKIDRNEFEQYIQKERLIIFSNINGYAYAWNHSFNGIPKADIYFV